MDEIKLLRGDDFVINDKLKIRHLTVNEIIDFAPENGEERYFSLVNLFIVRPYDLMDKLDEIGLDYEEVSEYELFIKLFCTGMYDEDLKLLIGDYNFMPYINKETNTIILYDAENDVRIDEEIYYQIRDCFLKMHHINLKPVRKAGNMAIKKYRIKQKRKEREKQKNEKYKSQLLELVSAIMVGTNGSVTFFNVWDMPIYSAYTALYLTLKLQNYSNTMIGVYTGNISFKDVPKEVLDWTNSI